MSDRNVKTKRTYREKLKSGAKFYSNLLRIFIATLLIGIITCGYLYYWLYRYEKQSINGAMTQYVKDVTDRKFDKVYYDDSRYFVELNTKEAVTDFLLYVFGDKKPGGVTFSWADSSGDTQYYDCYYRQSYICTLECKKPEGSKVWKVRTLIGSANYDIDILDGSSIRINDIPITSSFSHDDDMIPGAYEGYELDEKLPNVTRFHISNLVGEPAITSEQSNDVIVRDHSAYRYYVGPKATPEQYSDFAELITDTAMAYCQFITEDGTLYDLKQHLLPGTVFYDAVSSFDNQWFTTHESIEYQNLEILEVMPLGDNAFIGSIKFDYVVTATNVSQTYSNYYQMFFIKNDNEEWKCINIYTVSSDTEMPDMTVPEEGQEDTSTPAPVQTETPVYTETEEPVWSEEPVYVEPEYTEEPVYVEPVYTEPEYTEQPVYTEELPVYEEPAPAEETG